MHRICGQLQETIHHIVAGWPELAKTEYLHRHNKAAMLIPPLASAKIWIPGAPLTYFNDGGVRRIFLGLTFWPKGIFLGLWKTPGFFGVAKTTEGFFWVLYFSSAQIKNNISAIYSFVFDQNQSWSWYVLAFQKLNNKICWCKNTEGFFWVC